jgi:CheY-like chemotaxis protein
LAIPRVRESSKKPGRSRTENLKKSHPLPDSPSLNGIRVLVIDDEVDTRELLNVVLRQADAIVVAAASVKEALETLSRWRPDVIISDIGMPYEDGYALIRQLRILPPEMGGDVPAIAFTAFARSEDRIKALAAGYQTHVTKPVDPTELIAVVASLAGRTVRISRPQS